MLSNFCQFIIWSDARSPYIKLNDELPQDVPPHLATTQLSLLEKITPILPFGRGWNKPLLRFCHYSSR